MDEPLTSLDWIAVHFRRDLRSSDCEPMGCELGFRPAARMTDPTLGD